MSHEPVIIIGAGPAGLTAAYESTQQGIRPIILEKTDKVGGLAHTESYKGYYFDIGGHRFFTKIGKIHQLWQEMLSEDFLKVPRKSSIYYQNHFFSYPPNFFDVLSNLGIIECILIIASYLRSQLKPHPHVETFEQWVTNNFGYRFYKTFFQAYAEKVWGIPCHMISADWAVQRIKGVSLISVISKALWGRNKSKSMIDEFYYPWKGVGMMWERFKEVIEMRGGEIKFSSEVMGLKHEKGHITHVTFIRDEEKVTTPVRYIISSIPVNRLVSLLDPNIPDSVLRAASRLSYRTHITVGLIINKESLFRDQWIYVHNHDVKVARIQNFKNWSEDMVPDYRKSSVGMEYYSSKGDEIWSMSDTELIDLASRELTVMNLAGIEDIMDGFVIRQCDVYLVYDCDYKNNVEVIRQYLKGIDNLQTIGRNGLYRYNNMDHSMHTGMLAVQNMLGANHDLWHVNEEQEYLEEYQNAGS